MRIGELLRDRGWVDPAALDRAITEQRHTGKRLVSLLVARGLLGFDEAARALGQQLNVAAALQRHLDNRDRKLERAIPPELARSVFAIPIGRGRNGELIVAVRDPRASVGTAIEQVSKQKVLLAVSPASVLEKLVLETYGAEGTDDEFDVDMTTGPIDVPDELATIPRAATPIPVATLSEIGMDLSALGSMTLVELDDSRVSKDHTAAGPNHHSGSFLLPRAPTPSAPSPPGLAPAAITPPAIAAPFAEGTVIPSAPKIQVVSLDDTLVKLERAATRDDATDIAMVFVRGRWSSSILLTIKEGVALGHRGHGGHLTDDAVQAITVPLATTSIVRSAHDARRIVTEAPAKSGAIQDRIAKLMGQPKSPAAAPVLVGQRIACVLVVGDARDSKDATADMTLDLDDLSVALGLAYARILREAKKP